MLNHIHPTELDRACKDLSPITTFPAPGDINRAWLEPHAKAALDSVFKFISEWGTNPVRRIKARLQPFGETDPRGKEGITLDYELPPAFDPVTAAAILSAGGLDAIARSQETEKSFYFTQSHWVKNYIQAATESARKSRLEGERL
ncbi:MAG: hypothetical protein LAO21_17810 [Acidobacteriia bacterium]|nr:hypothetical protein [Terriglobia bacterium]